MSFTLTSTIKLPSGHTLPRLGLGVYRNDECYPACIAALKHGYRHIDSAQMYKNEAEVGRAVRDSGVPREEVFITSKIQAGYDPAETIQQSLSKVNLGYIDLYLIHSPHGGPEVRLRTWKALLTAKAEGKFRDVGVSNYNIKHIEEIRNAGLELPAVNQIELHPFCQQKSIVEYCLKHGIVVEAYCPLVRGAFDDPTLQEISKKVRKTPAQVLVRWSLQRGFVPLPKSANPERIKQNAEVFDFELSSEDMAKLDGLDRGKEGAISWNPVDVD
ncbi:Aldo/keto reductase [Vararia minispora EC-137]|uniref:Aldo/keto reductase n=1 Tax=Vararia minispora EC-137 TaxID=1314806 RepID=A0ACB8QT86_9AGAM|nr:Aldo/keto reductase [Vararia minispora EC-137]